MNSQNLTTYRNPNIVNYYQFLIQLQPAEIVILEKLRLQLPQFKMLDIGIGGGRTTTHFAPLVGEYCGIDYSPEMIATCKAKFTQKIPNFSLKVVDARDLSQFADNSFDFILFSFNGIDYVEHSDRLKILSEVARVGKKNAYFAFSSHNLKAMIQEFSYQKHLSWNPFKTYINLFMWAVLRFVNFSSTTQQLENSKYYLIRDESHNFRLQTYYIKPEAQIAQLAHIFRDIELYSWQYGSEIMTMADSVIDSDLWLYYLCRVKK